MSDWKAGMAFDSILQTPLDYYDVTYANGNTVRYEKERPHGEWKFIGDNLFKCTHCGYIADACYLREWKVHTYDAEFPTACLKCGADMREGDSDA